ncbi:MAG TPA: amidase [Candidatus Limnocylindria bacterium]|nr:amidase [Candidatus Limnocylindria bacterium]
MDELAHLDATAQAQLIRTGQLSPREAVDAAIERIERINPRLNAVIHPLFGKARAEAADPRLPAGPFRGVPILVKDLLCITAGDPYHAGLRMLRDVNWVEAEDCHLAAKLRAAGFVIVGKTNTPELGSMTTTEPAAYGATHNPWHLDHSPGGSSGGSASAVAAGLTAVAEANDGGGSIRIPASACGLVGLKPTRGRISLGPQLTDMWAGCVCEGFVTRSVRDTAALLDVAAGYMPGDPYTAPPPARPYSDEVGAPSGRLRIGLMTRAPGGTVPVHPECVAAAEATARTLADLGHVVEAEFPIAMDDPDAVIDFAVVVTTWIVRDLEHWSRRSGRPIDADTVESHNLTLYEMGRVQTAHGYIQAVERLQQHARKMLEWWVGGFDVLVTPTMAEPPARLGEFTPTPEDPARGFTRSIPFAIFTSPFNISGQPAISLPLAQSSAGLPIGVQLVAPYGREDLLIRVAAELEQAVPWRGRLPAVHA